MVSTDKGRIGNPVAIPLLLPQGQATALNHAIAVTSSSAAATITALQQQPQAQTSISSGADQSFTFQGWYEAVGAQLPFQSYMNNFAGGAGSSGVFEHSQLRDLKEVKTSQVGLSDKDLENISTRATIMHIKSYDISYPACRTASCNNKVTETNDSWNCEKCDRSFPKPKYRYLISMAVAD